MGKQRALRYGSRMNLRPRIPDLLALAACALLAFLALYNPIFHLPDHVTTDIVPVVTDYYHYHWNYWWMRHALMTGLPLYETNYVFAPFTSSLALHPMTPLWYPLWAVIEPLGGTAVAMTVIFFAGYTLTGFGFYLLLRDEGMSPGWALVGAAILELCTLMLTSARWTLVNLMAWFWLPILLLTWKRLIRSRGWHPFTWAIALGAVLWGMFLTDLQYPVFAAPLIIPYALWTLWRVPDNRTCLMAVAGGVVALVIGIVLATAAGPLDEAIRFDRAGLSPTPADRAVRIVFPDCYIINCTDGVSVGSIFLPLMIMALVVWRGKRLRLKRGAAPRWLWLIMIPVPLILSAGPSIQIGGSVIPMPYAIVHQLFGGMIRYPERFLPVFLIPGLLFVLSIFDARTRGRKAVFRLLPALFLLAVLVDMRVMRPIPVKALPHPYQAYEMMGAEPYDYVVVEIPTGGASGEGIVGDARYSELEFYGLTHGKRMVNAHLSRTNTYNYMYMNTDDPMMSWLGQRRFLEPVVVEQQMRERIPEWQIGYFVIHRDLIAPDQAAISEILAFFNAHDDLVCPILTEGDLVLYRTFWHPDGCPPRAPEANESGEMVIDLGAGDDARFMGEGWYPPEAIFDMSIRWADVSAMSSVYIDLLPGSYTLTVMAQAFHEPRQMSLCVNDLVVGDDVVVSASGLADYTFAIPASAIGDGQHTRISLVFDGSVTPREAGLGEDERKLAVMVDSLKFSE